MVSENNYSTKSILNLVNLGIKRQNKFILRHINLEIFSGEIVAIVGRSGIGKTTLLHAIAGYECPTEGCVLVNGQKIVAPGSERTMIFQSPTLFPWLTVRGNLKFALRHGKKGSIHSSSRINSLLERVGLKPYSELYPRQLSGGMQKRTEVARAFASVPSVLLADEPFSNNDEVTRRELHKLLFYEWKQTKATILLSTHDLEEAVFLANRILILNGSPARIEKCFDIPFCYPRELSLLQDLSFQETRTEIYQWILKNSI